MNTVTEQSLLLLGNFISQQFGLHFPVEKKMDLKRAIEEIARVYHYKNTQECIDWITHSTLSKSELEKIASFFIVGETYFFREKLSFEMLEHHILPTLIETRKKSSRFIRMWSAGCSSGEEAYSLAILLSKLIPDLEQWNIVILASDINLEALEKVQSGMYSEWSFRGNDHTIKKYFKQVHKCYEILPKFKKMVVPLYLNLVTDSFPSLLNNTNAMDVILCRNVLMYFVSDKVKQVVSNLEKSLVPGGCLLVSSNEHHLIHHPMLDSHTYSGFSFYRKVEEKWATPIQVEMISNEETKEIEKVEETEEVEEIKSQDKIKEEKKAEDFYAYVQSLANQGKLESALNLTTQRIALEKMNEQWYYLKALILIELGRLQEARNDLRRAIYLNRHFILPYFSMGNIARHQKDWGEAKKYFGIVLSLTENLPGSDILPGSEGLTVERIREVIRYISEASL